MFYHIKVNIAVGIDVLLYMVHGSFCVLNKYYKHSVALCL